MVNQVRALVESESLNNVTEINLTVKDENYHLILKQDYH